MQPPTDNRITQGAHLASQAVDYSYSPDPYVYAPEDMTFDSYQRRGSGKNSAGNALRGRGKTGLHQFGHLAEAYWKSGKVKRGDRIAKMGDTGYTIGGAHLHYWVKTSKGYVYPPNLYTMPFTKGGDVDETFKTEAEVKPFYMTLRGNEGSLAERQGWIGRKKISFITSKNTHTEAKNNASALKSARNKLAGLEDKVESAIEARDNALKAADKAEKEADKLRKKLESKDPDAGKFRQILDILGIKK